MGNPTIRTSYNIYYNVVSSNLELSLSLTNKQGNREDRNVNTFKMGDSSKRKFWTNQNSDKKNNKKPEFTSRNRFVLEDRKYHVK